MYAIFRKANLLFITGILQLIVYERLFIDNFDGFLKRYTCKDATSYDTNMSFSQYPGYNVAL